MNTTTNWPPGPRIYNLFPLLAGPLPTWTPHLERARHLGFDWVFINSFHYAGYSGSLYSVKDYYTLDPRLLDPEAGPPMDQLAQMIQTAKQLGLNLMMDLVINHTAFDSPLVTEHPQWYKRGADGKPLRPSAKEGEQRVVWGDLAEIDNANSPERDQLWRYWLQLAEHYAALGFRAFRCDAAYKVPVELWQFLFNRVKQSHPDALFFAESLGCPFADILRLARAGFDFIFNSSKWWDFTEPWCLDHYRQTAALTPSVSFAESHDTERLAAELLGDQAAVKLRYAFSALFSTGVMMPIGFEYGFRRRLDVVETRPEDWETPQWDLGDFITSVNRLKASYRVFNEEGPIESVDAGNPQVLAFVKYTLDRSERALVVLNKDRQRTQSCRLAHMGHVFSGTTRVEDLSPEERLVHSSDFQTAQLKPSGLHVLYAR
ncbi:MAG: alpha-amylase [Deltaproteobacteria bacterium]|nr:alpha-amylase [Deltaproteobacteria bacterium]